MIPLLAEAIEAHGGESRWRAHGRLSASFVITGELWDLKCVHQSGLPRTVHVDLHRQWASVDDIGKPGQRSDFTPDRVAILSGGSRTIAERRNPRASFDGHDMRTAWDLLHRAYFGGYALWTCLTVPFLLTMRGFTLREIEPWREGAEIWRGLRAVFPERLASHSLEQDFYFGPDMLIRRHDYHVQIAGNFPAAQYFSEPVVIDGITIPTRQRAYLRDRDLKPIPEDLMVGIDLSVVRFSPAESNAGS
ncbi:MULTISPECIES: hypothetical protein [Bradyrhizobium]|uniref:Uncharacterized protein n=1 Tax=Bradyrhizobium yuanmingense TaxID=108015 RepID=A0A1C3VTX9_9BRAD|nr:MULTISPECIES: hypothetical protein [Bradyrhizobium]MCA1381012.1 hypothetical protein [Bradyrhizobium sp. BRP05]MCA1388901.1 hypothetical protein [Bradyrhizobium sp. IC3123]MCA1418867.1 hypothetical protein [Bradyrhizobium sp. BRP23]MCA1432727.1 hypothetical protein [Bradyrhizobium sp. BRP20]MCA1466760.1 hypothetical protein [Bradyrhizobium sp. IC3195]